MANTINYWIKTAVTTLVDAKQFLVSGTTGAADVITWGSIKSLLKTFFQGEALTFTDTITMDELVLSGNLDADSNKLVNLTDGADAQDAVTKSQLDAKQTKATGFTVDMIVSVDNSGFIKESIYKQNRTINALNIPELTAAPADSGDGMGNDGDFGFYGDYFYRKDSVSGWLRSERYVTF